MLNFTSLLDASDPVAVGVRVLATGNGRQPVCLGERMAPNVVGCRDEEFGGKTPACRGRGSISAPAIFDTLTDPWTGERDRPVRGPRTVPRASFRRGPGEGRRLRRPALLRFALWSALHLPLAFLVR